MCCFVASNGILFVVGSVHQGADHRNSSLFTILQDVKEPTYFSKREGDGVPGVVVWPCCVRVILRHICT